MKLRIPCFTFALAAALFLFFITIMSAGAETVLDWGGFLSGTGEVGLLPDADFEASGQAGLWLRADFSEDFGLYGRGSYLYDEDRPFFADINSLYAEGQVLPGEDTEQYLLRYRAGRFRFSEFTGYVLNQSLDGLRLNFELSKLSLEAAAGYTGLLFIPSSSILVTQSDYDVSVAVPESGYGLASPKAIETFRLTVPGLTLGQDFLFDVVLQQDLQAEEDLRSDDDRIHTEHIGFGFRGRLAPSVYQNVFYYFNYGHGKYTTAAHLFGGGLSYYNEDFHYTRVRIRGFYSSGDNDQNFFYGGYSGGDTSTHFIALSSAPVSGLVFSPEIGNLTLCEVSLSMRPLSESRNSALEKFQTSLAALAFFRNTGGAISEGGIDGTSDESYLGSEVNMALRFRPFSDFGFSLAGGIFLPNDGAFLDTAADVQSVLRLDFSLNF